MVTCSIHIQSQSSGNQQTTNTERYTYSLYVTTTGLISVIQPPRYIERAYLIGEPCQIGAVESVGINKLFIMM